MVKDYSPEVRVEFELCLNIGFCLIQEAFLDTLSDGNHHSYPVSCSSSGKHIERASCPLTPMQNVKQGFWESSSCLCAVYLHLFYCNHSWKW